MTSRVCALRIRAPGESRSGLPSKVMAGAAVTTMVARRALLGNWRTDVCAVPSRLTAVRQTAKKSLRASVERELGEQWQRFMRSEEHTSELQSRQYLVCRLLLEKKKKL